MIDNIEGRIKLNTGIEMPGFGFGCYKAEGTELIDALLAAFDCGYRYIDSAAFYENEKTVGEAIRKSGIRREDIFVVSKIWPSRFSNPIKALDTTLADLNLEYLDGYLLHWPGLNEKSRYMAYEKLLRELEKGKIRMLGVSNFLADQLENLHAEFGIWAPVNQIEIHPLFQQPDLCEFCAARQIQVISWGPLGRGKEMQLETILEIAKSLSRTPAQVILRWQIQKNYVPIPKSVHEKRIRENAEVFNFSLDESQMTAIDNLNMPDAKGRLGKDPLQFPPL